MASPDAGRAPIAGVKNIIAVGAGKGGVGKSTVAVNLALALSRYGGRVGMIDADVYGPNIPIMLGVRTQLETDGKKIVPAEKHGIPVVSMGFLTQDETPIIWRGPMLHGVVQQFFREVRWPELDYLVVDMPPGTGDVALSLSQTVPVSGAVVVTTPQTVSLADSRRAVAMYKKLNVPTLGVVENMSHFVCPSCDHESDIFGQGGGESVAAEMGVPFLGRIPIYQPIREGWRQRQPDRDRRAGLGRRARVLRRGRTHRRPGLDRGSHPGHGGGVLGFPARRGFVHAGLRPAPHANATRGPRSPTPRPRGAHVSALAVTEEQRRPGALPSVFLARRSPGKARRGSMQVACDRGSNATRRDAPPGNPIVFRLRRS